MKALLSKLESVLAPGFAYAARTAALREAMPWDEGLGTDAHKARLSGGDATDGAAGPDACSRDPLPC